MNHKPKYNPQIHHRRSIRLKGYDYAQAGLYFITLCCKDRKCLFGEIVSGNGVGAEMVLNEFGRIAHNEWLKTPELRPNIELGDFVIMPNHLHGIIKIIHRGECNSPRNTESCSEIGGESHSPKNVNSIDKGECNSPRRCNSPRQTVGAIVRGYKSAVTKQLNQINIGCAVWQRNYHEHIIRTDKALYNISKYIRNNSQKWAEDQFNGK